VAIVATARHMAESVYWVLTRKEYHKENKAIRALFHDPLEDRQNEWGATPNDA